MWETSSEEIAYLVRSKPYGFSSIGLTFSTVLLHTELISNHKCNTVHEN